MVDPVSGAILYRLSDRTLCPQGAAHYYSYTPQFSPSGRMVFTCRYDATNPNLRHQVVYDVDFKLLYADAGAASGYRGDCTEIMWSTVKETLYCLAGTTVTELDPFKKANRVVLDLAKKTPLVDSAGLAHPANRGMQFIVGPGDRMTVHIQSGVNYSGSNIVGIAAFDANGAYAQMLVPVTGDKAPSGFDEVQFSQSPKGRMTLVYGAAPNFSYTTDLSSRVQFDDNHGHRGYFNGSNGRSYKVNAVNNTLTGKRAGQVGQIGCVVAGKWRPAFALYNVETGKKEFEFNCGPAPEVIAGDHFSSSAAPDVWFGSSDNIIARYTAHYDGSGNPNQVTTETVTSLVGSNQKTCGYWAYSRANSDATGTKALFDSTAGGGCKTDVYVVAIGGVAPPPPPALACTLNGNILHCTPPSGNPFTIVVTEP